MSHSTAQQGVTQWRGYTLLLLTLVYTFSVLDRFILGILLPQIKQELLLNDAQQENLNTLKQYLKQELNIKI